MTKLFTLIATFFCLLKAIDFIYLFQTKEYRFDRFHSLLKDEGVLRVFYLRFIRWPAKTLRNFLLCLFSFISGGLYFLVLQQSSLFILLAVILLTPAVAFLVVSLGVVITFFPA